MGGTSHPFPSPALGTTRHSFPNLHLGGTSHPFPSLALCGLDPIGVGRSRGARPQKPSPEPQPRLLPLLCHAVALIFALSSPAHDASVFSLVHVHQRAAASQCGSLLVQLRDLQLLLCRGAPLC